LKWGHMLVYAGFDAKGKRVIVAALEPKDMVLLRAGQKIAFDTSARAPEFPPIGVILDYTEHPEKYRARRHMLKVKGTGKKANYKIVPITDPAHNVLARAVKWHWERLRSERAPVAPGEGRTGDRSRSA
jgi:hypothetical protein